MLRITLVPFFDRKKTLFRLVCLVYRRYVSCAALVLRRDSPSDIDFPAPKTLLSPPSVSRPTRTAPFGPCYCQCKGRYTKGGRRRLFNGRSSRHANVAHTRTAIHDCAKGGWRVKLVGHTYPIDRTPYNPKRPLHPFKGEARGCL